MQNAKDSFYEVLRDRLAALNADRTIVVRGVTRPAILVDENETTSVAEMNDCFHLRWTETEAKVKGECPLVTLTCEVVYSTQGNGWNAGLDRGRCMASLDADLLAAVRAYPQNTIKKAYSAPEQGGTATDMKSRVWWSDLLLGPIKAKADRLTRTATLQVMCFEEGAEK